jgi:hypothetical protein
MWTLERSDLRIKKYTVAITTNDKINIQGADSKLGQTLWTHLIQ